MAVVVNGQTIPMRALTAEEKAEMAEDRPVTEALRRYLVPLTIQQRIDRRRRLNGLADRIVLRMEHRHGGDTLTRATERMRRFEREADAMRAEGREPSRWHDLRRVAAAKVYRTFRDRIEKPAGMDGYEWAEWQAERGR